MSHAEESTNTRQIKPLGAARAKGAEQASFRENGLSKNGFWRVHLPLLLPLEVPLLSNCEKPQPQPLSWLQNVAVHESCLDDRFSVCPLNHPLAHPNFEDLSARSPSDDLQLVFAIRLRDESVS